MTITIEEALRSIEHHAALLRYTAHAASINPEGPDSSVLSGMGDLCGEIEVTVHRARHSLAADALTTSLKRFGARVDG